MTDTQVAQYDATLSGPQKITIMNGLTQLQRAIALNNYNKGWRNPPSDVGRELRNVGEVCMLITTEIAEAYEAFREGDDYEVISYEHPETKEKTDFDVIGGQLTKPVGVASELADVIIRVLDIADEFDIPVIEAILEKHDYNLTRPYRHGGKVA